MDNKYIFFFQEVRKFIIDLGIEKEADVVGCTTEEIEEIENQFGKLPLTYKVYLETFGRNFLFSFFDGEHFSYNDYEDINKFVKRTLRDDNFEITRPFIAISHYHYEYFSFIYLDENKNDNPKVWSYQSDYDEDSENPKIAEDRFTDTILLFFKRALANRSASFHWVDANEENKNIVQDRYVDWARKITQSVDYIYSSPTDNQLVKRIHQIVFSYFEPQKETIMKLAKGEINIGGDNGTGSSKKKKDIWNKIFKWSR